MVSPKPLVSRVVCLLLQNIMKPFTSGADTSSTQALQSGVATAFAAEEVRNHQLGSERRETCKPRTWVETYTLLA